MSAAPALATSYWLEQAGVEHVLLERRDRLGGGAIHLEGQPAAEQLIEYDTNICRSARKRFCSSSESKPGRISGSSASSQAVRPFRRDTDHARDLLPRRWRSDLVSGSAFGWRKPPVADDAI